MVKGDSEGRRWWQRGDGGGEGRRWWWLGKGVVVVRVKDDGGVQRWWW